MAFVASVGVVLGVLTRLSVVGVVPDGRPGADPERGPETKVDSDLEVSYTRTCGVGSQAI